MLHQQLLTWSFKEVDLHAAERYSRFEVVSDSRFLLAEDLGHLRTHKQNSIYTTRPLVLRTHGYRYWQWQQNCTTTLR